MTDLKQEMRDLFLNAEELKWQGPKKPLLQVMNNLFFSIIQVDLTTDIANVQQSADYPEFVGRFINWTKYLNYYKKFLHTDGLEVFLSENLRKQCQNGQKSISKDFSYSSFASLEWITIDAFFDYEEDNSFATIIVRKSSKEHLLNSIINLYVYNNCDYFIYLDAKNNSYTMFSGTSSGTPLPPAICNDYSLELIKYADDFVVPEDREKVKFEMSIERVLEKLEQANTHSFTCGIIDPVHGYTRKRLEYRYYDRSTQMILLSRTDITDIYLDSLKRQEELQLALKRACTDSLTRLLNRQGIEDEITLRLLNDSRPSAMLVIDLDNFKKVNDSFGHTIGDKLLRHVAEALQSQVHCDDLVGRIGGDEFLIFLYNIHNAQDISRRAQQLCESIRRLSFRSDCPISCSIGISFFPEDGKDYKTLFKCADENAYRAKSKGKNCVVSN